MDRDNDERDEGIVEARVTGVSTRALAKQHGCTGREIEEAVDRRLSYELDNQQRLRLVKLSVARIEGLMRPFYERATKDKDVAAGTLCCKLEERLSMLLGLDNPVTQRVDVYAVEAERHVDSTTQIEEAIARVIAAAPPAERALRKRLEEISPERALELLNQGGDGGGNGSDVGPVDAKGPQPRLDGNGTGAVNAVPMLPDPELGHSAHVRAPARSAWALSPRPSGAV